MLLRCVLASVLVCSTSVLAVQGDTASAFQVTTPAASKAVEWTVDKLKADFAGEIKTIEHTSHGQTHKSRCVSLLTVLRSAGVNADVGKNPTAPPKDKNAVLRMLVIVKGRDGYTATFSLAELLPEIGNREAWLAIDEDDKALAARDGPVKLVVPSDVKPGRWVHQIATIEVVDAAALPTTEPAAAAAPASPNR